MTNRVNVSGGGRLGLAAVGDVESSLLCELVDRLTETRTEQAVRTTIDAWNDRVQAAGLDPHALFEIFKRAPAGARSAHDAVQRWANASKRELVLVCMSLYARGRKS